MQSSKWRGSDCLAGRGNRVSHGPRLGHGRIMMLDERPACCRREVDLQMDRQRAQRLTYVQNIAKPQREIERHLDAQNSTYNTKCFCHRKQLDHRSARHSSDTPPADLRYTRPALCRFPSKTVSIFDATCLDPANRTSDVWGAAALIAAYLYCREHHYRATRHRPSHLTRTRNNKQVHTACLCDTMFIDSR